MSNLWLSLGVTQSIIAGLAVRLDSPIWLAGLMLAGWSFFKAWRVKDA